MEQKEITLVYAYGTDNSGDMAINLGAIDIIQEAYDGQKLNLISRFSENSDGFIKTKAFIEGYNENTCVYPGPFDFDRHKQSKIMQIKNIILNGIIYVYYSAAPKKRYNECHSDAVRVLLRSDTILFNGGNLFRWNIYRKELKSLLAYSFPLVVAKKAGVDYGFLPQSIGEIDGFGKYYLRGLFNQARFITFREKKSEIIFKKCFAAIKNTETFIDLAFFIKLVDSEKCKAILEQYSLVGEEYFTITLRNTKIGDTHELCSSDNHNIISVITEVINSLLNMYCRHKVLLVCQTKKDVEITQIVLNNVNNSRLLSVEEYDPIVLKALYAKSSALIAMRLHSAILALSEGTPVYGIYKKEWGDKMPGTLDEFDQEYTTLEEFEIGNVLRAVDRYLSDKESIEAFIRNKIELNRNLIIDYIRRHIAKG